MSGRCTCLPQAIISNIFTVLIADAFFFVSILAVVKLHGKAVVQLTAVFARIGYAGSVALFKEIICSKVIDNLFVRLPLAYRAVSSRHDFKSVIAPEHVCICQASNLIDNIPGFLCAGVVCWR